MGLVAELHLHNLARAHAGLYLAIHQDVALVGLHEARSGTREERLAGNLIPRLGDGVENLYVGVELIPRRRMTQVVTVLLAAQRLLKNHAVHTAEEQHMAVARGDCRGAHRSPAIGMARPLARLQVQLQNTHRHARRVGVVTSKNIKVHVGAVALHHRGGLQASLSGHLGKALPRLSAGVCQPPHRVLGSLAVAPAHKVDVAVIKRGGALGNAHGEGRQMVDILVLHAQHIRQQLQAVRTANGNERVLRIHVSSIGCGVWQFHLGAGMPSPRAQSPHLVIEHLLASVGGRHIGEIASASNHQPFALPAHEGCRNALRAADVVRREYFKVDALLCKSQQRQEHQ